MGCRAVASTDPLVRRRVSSGLKVSQRRPQEVTLDDLRRRRLGRRPSRRVSDGRCRPTLGSPTITRGRLRCTGPARTDRGLWVSALATSGYQVWAINPMAAARYRDRHHVSGAKSDAGDAKLLADLVRTDRHNHRQIAGATPDAEAIKVLARTHQSLIWARTRHANMCRSGLREYYPAALEAFDSLTDGDALAVLGRAPTPEQGSRLSMAKIGSALKAAGRQRNVETRAVEIQDIMRREHLPA